MMNKGVEMEYGKAFTFAMEDPDWIKKLGIAAAIVFVAIVGSVFLLIPTIAGLLLLSGYAVEIARRVINNEAKPLPEWTDFGNLFKNGLFLAIALFVYSLPSILLSVCAQSNSFLPAMLRGNVDRDIVEMAQTVTGVLALCCSCVQFIYSIFIGMLTPAVAGQVASKGTIGAAFDFKAVFGHLRAQPVVYLLVFLITAVAGFVLALVGMIVCGIGLFVTLPFATFVNAHLWGQAYRFTSSKLGEAPAA
ncbi:MAG: DUF4013 domain-containing protein [Chloroflexi bacterium]|nr:DUF4013 domain-containing protein [Chloroflexota bacterium]